MITTMMVTNSTMLPARSSSPGQALGAGEHPLCRPKHVPRMAATEHDRNSSYSYSHSHSYSQLPAEGCLTKLATSAAR